jgi:hypothetical protein
MREEGNKCIKTYGNIFRYYRRADKELTIQMTGQDSDAGFQKGRGMVRLHSNTENKPVIYRQN